MFQYTNVYLAAKFGDLKPTIEEERLPTFHKEIAIFFWLNV